MTDPHEPPLTAKEAGQVALRFLRVPEEYRQ
jgi:hypothetical protein